MRLLLPTLLALLLMAGCSSSEDWTKPLNEALQGTNRLHIRSGGTCHRVPAEEKTHLELRDADQIAEVIQAIAINPGDSGTHCRCCGNPTLEFYRDETLVSLGFHHGRSLRWMDGEWEGDAALTEGSAKYLLQWLVEHDVPAPRE